jgi:hypothetical protein
MAGIRFFKMSFADINRTGVTLGIDNNDTIKDYLVSRNNRFVWESTGSDDSNSITFTVTFDTSREIDTLILTVCNLKGFTLDYLNGVGAWVNLITETTNADETYFQQFTPVSTTAVRFIMNTTMTADQEKTLRDFIITKQIGQLVGYPDIDIPRKPTSSKKTMMTGKEKILQSGVDNSIRLNFQNHMGNADRNLFDTLVEYTEEFLIWPNGGDSDQFVHNDIGYRAEDIFLVQMDPAGYTHQFTKNLYFSGMNAQVMLVEVA